MEVSESMAKSPPGKKPTSPLTNTSFEIERKFLVDKFPEGFERFPSKEMFQGYLAVTRDGTEVRIRKQGSKCSLAVKHGSGKTRVEEEIEIGERQFASLWELTGRKRVTKRRYRISHGDMSIDLDVYQEKLEGLITAEVEFPSEGDSDAFRPPEYGKR